MKLIACLLSFGITTPAFGQPATVLSLKVLRGDGVVNYPAAPQAIQPVVEVDDSEGHPVAGAEVTYLLPSAGPGGSIHGWMRATVIVTGANGQASLEGWAPNMEVGDFKIKVTAVAGSARTSILIHQTNAPSDPALTKGHKHKKCDCASSGGLDLISQP
jgi:hypothetical protein